MTVKVELRRVPEGAADYECVATMTVHDQQWELDDPEGFFPVDLPVLVIEDSAMRSVQLHEDPATWARNLDTILRGGYLVPVVVLDDGDG